MADKPDFKSFGQWLSQAKKAEGKTGKDVITSVEDARRLRAQDAEKKKG